MEQIDIVYDFQSLTPLKDTDLDGYREAFDFVSKHEDICNVAVSGAYGSGKSSVLETLKSVDQSHKYINISLADFTNTETAGNNFHSDKEDSKDANKKQTSKDNRLEGKILNQLIHQINPDDIPLTNFRIKREPDKKESGKQAVIIILTLLSLIYLLSYSSVKDFIANNESFASLEWLLHPLTCIVLLNTGMISALMMRLSACCC